MTTEEKLQMDLGVVKQQVKTMVEMSKHCKDDRERIVFYMLSLTSVPQMHRSDYAIQLIAMLINELGKYNEYRGIITKSE